MQAPFPRDEAARLDALREYGALDTLPEAAYDDLVRLASQICDAPITLITLIDRDRQWFKSAVGFAAAETPRDVAFCAHTILQHEVLVVPDARDDPRFADNPFVTDSPHIRFYAAAPLVTPSGHALGSLCVLDDRPRELAPEQREALQALARQVMAQLELRRHVAELQTAIAAREREMRERNLASAHYEAVLLDLARAETAEPEAELQRILRVDAGALGVARVAIWIFDDGGDEMVCRLQHLVDGDRWESGARLRVERLPNYFGALRERRAIAAHDALADPATRDLAADYLLPLGITSMLEIPLWRGGRMVGVVCHEHTGPRREWTVDEQEFAASVADLASRTMEAAERRETEAALQRSESRFRTMFEQFPLRHPGRAGAGPGGDPGRHRPLLRRRRAAGVDGGACSALRDGGPARSVGAADRRDHVGVRGVSALLRPGGSGVGGRARPPGGARGGQRPPDYLRAQEATRARDQVLAVVAHDLRDPLGTITMGASLVQELLGSDDSQAEARRHLDIVVRSAQRMNRLIGDLLDLSRVEGNGFALEIGPEALDPLLAEAAATLGPLAQARGIRMESEGCTGLPTIPADGARLLQVISNLVGNAIKFTPEGGRIALVAEREADEVRISVVDPGPGIPAEQISNLFRRFWQADATDRRGLGLGLSIARGIVEAHRGRI